MCRNRNLLLLLKALVNVAYEMGSSKLSIISSNKATIETFLSEATALGIRIPHVLEYKPHDQDLPCKLSMQNQY